MGFHKNFSAGGTDTSDATANQWDVKNGLTAYIASGKVTGSGYFPAMMQLNGSTGFYSAAYTSSGNKVTGVIRFARATFTGNRVEYLARANGPSLHIRLGVFICSSDFSTAAYQNRLVVRSQNSAGTTICNLTSVSNLLDDEPHELFYAFDGDAGTAVFRVDGNDEDDTGSAVRTAPTTGTLDTGASSGLLLGSASLAGSQYFAGKLGHFGMRDVGGLTYSDFMQTDGSPKELDTATWTEWGGTQPAFFHESAKLDENLGSAGAMTKNGTITLAAASSWS